MKFFKIERKYGCDGDGRLYLTRIQLFETLNWRLCLHIIHRSDSGAWHDHPWEFWTLPIWRGYWDSIDQWRLERVWPGLIYYRPALHKHKIILIKDKPAVSLVLMGKRVRPWGFYTDEGWVESEEYFAEQGC